MRQALNEVTGQQKAEAAMDQAAKARALADEQWDLFSVACSEHADYLARAQKFDEFYLGKQWTEKDEKKLAGQGRPALTINQTMPIVNVVLGEQATRRADVKLKPKKNATIEDASMMQRVYDWVMEENMQGWVESQIFSDGIIQERGFYDVRINFDENLFGHINITADDPGDVIPDPNAKEYDPDTWDEVWYTRWCSLDYIEENYGIDKREKLEGLATSGLTKGIDSFHFVTRKEPRFGEEEQNAQWFAGVTSEKEKRRVKTVRLIERQFKQLHWVQYFIDPISGDKSPVPPTWNQERVVNFAASIGLYVHKVRERRIRWRVTVDSVLLHDTWSPYHTYTKIPFFPYFRRGKSAGVVTNLISPQEMLNKISSQVTHVVNTTANSGWIYEAGSLVNMTPQQLKERGAETGLVIEVAAGSQPPEKITPNSIPTGLERITINAQNNMKEISGVTDALLGLESAEVSGVALESKEKRGQIQIQVPLDNLAKTRFFLVRKVVNLIQQFMTEQRLLTIVNERPQPGQPETEELVINQRTAGKILNDVTKGTYSWVIGSQPTRDSFNDSQFAESIAMRQVGLMIPDDRIVEFSNLENKMELAEEIRQAQGRGTQSPEEQQMAQLLREFALMREQLELAELEQKVHLLRSQVELNFAKTGEIDATMQLNLDKLESDVALAREGFDLRKKLNRDQSINKLEGKVIDHKALTAQRFTAATLQQLTTDSR